MTTLKSRIPNNSFPECIGRSSTVDWPTRSWDLTPHDILVWGIMKNKVFSQRLTDLKHPRTIIEAQFENMDEDKNLCTTIVNCVAERCRRCIEHNYKHSEQFL
jgi:hypothetical protein